VVNFGTLEDHLDNAKEDGNSLKEVEVKKLFKSLVTVKV